AHRLVAPPRRDARRPRTRRHQLAEDLPERRQVLAIDPLVERLAFSGPFRSNEHHGVDAPVCKPCSSASGARRKKEMHSAASDAISTGAAATRKICRIGQCRDRSCPPIIGPTMEPILPIPSAQPTPVERIAVGYEFAVSALAPIWPPTTQNPAPKTVRTSERIEGPTVPMSSTKTLRAR